MKHFLITLFALLLPLCFAPLPTARAQEPFGAAAPGATPFSAAELRDLLAPIALYPDPLIAQILPAATFVDQIDEAARFVRRYGVVPGIDDQPWDVSVKAVAHYPEILFMMDGQRDWTIALGQAFVTQETAVMNAIQRLRAEARAQGNLVSTPQQVVIVDGGIIRILPAQPNLIYIPVYDPLAVYVEPPPPGLEFIFFGSGFAIGAWLNRDFNWHRHRIYFHGWQGGGWVGRARPHLRHRKGIYFEHRNSIIHRDRGVTRRDILRYRSRLRNDIRLRRERLAPAPRRGRIERPRIPQRSPAVRPTPPPPSPRIRERSKRREVPRNRNLRRNRPASQSGYGGYGNRRDAEHYHERGRRSLENMQRRQRVAPHRQTRPAHRPGISGRRPARQPATQAAPRRAPRDKTIQERERRRR